MDDKENICPLCSLKVKHVEKSIVHQGNSIGNDYEIECQKCGKYRIKDRTHLHYFSKEYSSERERTNVSSWLASNQNAYIDEELCKKLKKLQCIPLQDRIYILLIEISNLTNHIGKTVTIDTEAPKLLLATWSINGKEILEMLKHLQSRNFIKYDDKHPNFVLVTILTAGWLYIEEQSKKNVNSDQGFIAMWFNETTKNAYEEAIAPAINDAGYREIRIDKYEHNNDITDEIIAQIRRSKFLVADYTEHRGGVYYEAGFARGLGLEVFMTCRKDHMKKLHFDVNHQVCIEWVDDDLASLRKKLANKIEATIGRGPFLPTA